MVLDLLVRSEVVLLHFRLFYLSLDLGPIAVQLNLLSIPLPHPHTLCSLLSSSLLFTIFRLSFVLFWFPLRLRLKRAQHPLFISSSFPANPSLRFCCAFYSWNTGIVFPTSWESQLLTGDPAIWQIICEGVKIKSGIPRVLGVECEPLFRLYELWEIYLFQKMELRCFDFDKS